MGKVFVGQTALTIILDCGVDVSAATTLLIKCTKADGTDKSLSATLVDGSTTKIQHAVADSKLLNEKGDYLFWAYIKWDATNIASGEVAKLTVYDEGTLR